MRLFSSDGKKEECSNKLIRILFYLILTYDERDSCLIARRKILASEICSALSA